MKVELHSLVSEDSKRCLDGGVKWFGEMKLSICTMDKWEDRGMVRIHKP